MRGGVYPAALGLSSLDVISYPLQDGELGTIETINHIRRLVDQGIKDSRVRCFAEKILRAADPYNSHGYDDAFKVRAIFEWVVRHIHYVKDPPGKELLRPAAVLLQVRAGDCDDLNGVLLPSLLGSVGYECRVVTISTHPQAPEEFSHIFCEVLVNGKWVALDAARKGAAWQKPAGQHYRMRVWSLLDGAYQDVRGLAGYAALTAPVRRLRRPTLGFDWGAFANLLNVGTAGVAKVISAVKSPPGGMFVPTPTGGGGSYSNSPTTNYTPLLIGAAVLGAVLLLRK